MGRNPFDTSDSSLNPDPTGNVLDLLLRGRQTKLKSAMAWSVAFGGFAVTSYRQIDSWRRGKYFTVKIKDNDDIYLDVREWLLNQLPDESRKAIEVFTRRQSSRTSSERMFEAIVADDPRRSVERGVYSVYDGERTQEIKIKSQAIEVAMYRPDQNAQSMKTEPGTVTFTAKDRKGRDAVISFLSDVAKAHEEGKKGAQIRMATRWGDWRFAQESPQRPLESVVLAEGQIEHLASDLQRFLDDEKQYGRLGIPWHRGYLLYGPPGSGKSSVVKALAEHFKLTLYVVGLSDLEADADLSRLLGEIEPRSIILLEDIDVAHAAKSRDDSESSISLSGILNALDGVATPHGMLTFMTTNNREVLDQALVRTGRADVKMEITYLTDEQMGRLVKFALGDVDVILPSVEGCGIAAVDIIELIKPYLRDDPQKVAPILAMELQALVDKRAREASDA